MSEESQRAYLLREGQTTGSDFLNSQSGNVDTCFYGDLNRIPSKILALIALDTCIQSHHTHNIRNIYECLTVKK